jgi:D-amino-acid dehydrogenase
MNIVVIGGGVVGVTTAYFLSQAGFNVTVLEAQGQGEDLGATASNAGFLSPSDAFAWASPSSLQTVIKSMLNPDLGVRYKFKLDPKLWHWSGQFLSQCWRSQWVRNSENRYRLAAYSMEMLEQLRQTTQINFDASDQGITYATRDLSELKSLKQHFNFLQDRGLELQMLDKDSLYNKLPLLQQGEQVYAGAVHSPNCKTGDSAKLVRELTSWCEQHTSCRFIRGAKVERIVKEGNKICAVVTSQGEFKADAYVLSAGSYSAELARPLGIKLPIYPIKGFSITAPLLEDNIPPMPGFDDTEKLVALSVFGNRLRMASSAVFDGQDTSFRQQDFQGILKLAKQILPDVADYQRAEYRAALRPMTPKSLPILGPSGLDNFYLNVGHGNLGWTLSFASAKILADIIGKQPTEFDLAPFSL